MPITVKGNVTAEETIVKIATPAVVSKNLIHEKLKQLQETPITVNEPKLIKQKIESIDKCLHRQIPVKTNELVDDQKYRNVQEAELIKCYNMRSEYLADMIDNNIDSD